MAEMTPERIAEIRAREQAATKGPWYHEDGLDRAKYGYRIYDRYGGICKPTRGVDAQDEANSEFILNARQDIPDLLDALADLQKRVADLESAIERAADDALVQDALDNRP